MTTYNLPIKLKRQIKKNLNKDLINFIEKYKFIEMVDWKTKRTFIHCFTWKKRISKNLGISIIRNFKKNWNDSWNDFIFIVEIWKFNESVNTWKMQEQNFKNDNWKNCEKWILANFKKELELILKNEN